MSDCEGGGDTKKRGRPAAMVETPKKRPRALSPKKESTIMNSVSGESPAKRGRGRPKGSTKKTHISKITSLKKTINNSSRGRGRPAKTTSPNFKDDSGDSVDDDDDDDADDTGSDDSGSDDKDD